MGKTIEVNGVKYREVDRRPRMGDFVLALRSQTDTTKGNVYEIYGVDEDGDGKYRDDVGDTRYFCSNDDDDQLVEKVTESVSGEISALKVKIAELEARVEAEKMQQPISLEVTKRELECLCKAMGEVGYGYDLFMRLHNMVRDMG